VHGVGLLSARVSGWVVVVVENGDVWCEFIECTSEWVGGGGGREWRWCVDVMQSQFIILLMDV
jgi:hypothetical protein